MEKVDIINQLKTNYGYTIKNFVSKEYYQLKGEGGWDSLSANILETFLKLCQNTTKQLVVNNWSSYADSEYDKIYVFKYRGFRNGNEYGSSSKLSQHKVGNAIDFHVVGEDPNITRSWIMSIGDKLPYNIRMESDVNWVHIDIGTSIKTKNVSNSDKSGRKSIDGGLDYVKKIFTNLRDNFGFKEIVIEN